MNDCTMQCSRRRFLAGGLAAAAFAGQRARAVEGPRDVLFIAVDDLNTRLGCYGDPIAQTPNIDRLAARGMRFDNAQCQYPVCNPSRSSLLTGRYPDSIGVLTNSLDWNERIPAGASVPEFFRAHGYQTVRIGKIFHEGNAGRKYDDSSRWASILTDFRGLPPRTPAGPPSGVLYDDVPKAERQKVYDMRAWEWGPVPGDDLNTGDGRVAEVAARFLRRAGGEPLFFAVGFHKPHLTLRAPQSYFDLYPPEKMPLPDYPEDDLEDVPANYRLANHRHFTDRKRGEAIAAYYACVSLVDSCVGRLLRALEESGRTDRTIIVLWGDHGFHLGEHLLWQKSTLFEESCRVPLLVVAPGVAEPGSICRRPVESMDLFPTLADLCGLPAPAGIESISMKPLLRAPDRPWRKGALTMTGWGRSLRTERYRYNEWKGNRRELYDHQTDPRELHNLAKDPAQAGVVAQMSDLLRAQWRQRLPEK